MPDTIQCAIFSATMPLEVLEVTNKFMRDPVRILVKKDELTLEGIKQFFIAIEKEVLNPNPNPNCDSNITLIGDRIGNWTPCVICMPH